MRKKKYLLVVIMSLVLCLLVVVFVKNKRTNASISIEDKVGFVDCLNHMKLTPFVKIEINDKMKGKVEVEYRVFKPSLNLLAIPNGLTDSQTDPLDAFLRFAYTAYCDPNPTYDKLSQSFLAGRQFVDDLLLKVPEYVNDEKGYFQSIRHGIVKSRLLGEVVCDTVHMYVYALVYSDQDVWPRGVTMVPKDGKFYHEPNAKERYDILINMSAEKYHVIFKHFPEYKVKDE